MYSERFAHNESTPVLQSLPCMGGLESLSSSPPTLSPPPPSAEPSPLPLQPPASTSVPMPASQRPAAAALSPAPLRSPEPHSLPAAEDSSSSTAAMLGMLLLSILVRQEATAGLGCRGGGMGSVAAVASTANSSCGAAANSSAPAQEKEGLLAPRLDTLRSTCARHREPFASGASWSGATAPSRRRRPSCRGKCAGPAYACHRSCQRFGHLLAAPLYLPPPMCTFRPPPGLAHVQDQATADHGGVGGPLCAAAAVHSFGTAAAGGGAARIAGKGGAAGRSLSLVSSKGQHALLAQGLQRSLRLLLNVPIA